MGGSTYRAAHRGRPIVVTTSSAAFRQQGAVRRVSGAPLNPRRDIRCLAEPSSPS